jgi:hypothetical protein
MAQAFSKVKLSGGTDGKPIKVVQTASTGTTIHTAHATALDEIWLWVTNTSGSAVTLTIEWGGVTSPDCLMVAAYSIPANSGMVQVVPGILLTNAILVTAFASSANVLLINGYVNRIT